MKHSLQGTRAALAALLVVTAGLTAANVAEAGGGNGKHWKKGRAHSVRVVRGKPKKVRAVVVQEPRYRTRYAVHPDYGRVDFGLYRGGHGWVARPAAVQCFVVQRPRVVVVRPVPVWVYAPARSGIAGSFCYGDGNTRVSFAWADQSPRYGCAVCGDDFGSYGAWQDHSYGCAHDAYGGHLAFESWDQGDLDYFRFRLDVSGLSG